jgi:uncharacterized membrane protein
MLQLLEELQPDFVLGMFYQFGTCCMDLCFQVETTQQSYSLSILGNTYLKLQLVSKITNKVLLNQEIMFKILVANLMLELQEVTLAQFRLEECLRTLLITINKGASNQTNL